MKTKLIKIPIKTLIYQCSSTTGAPGLTDRSEIDRLRDHCQLALSDYISQNYSDQATRFGRLLLILGRLQRISPGEPKIIVVHH